MKKYITYLTFYSGTKLPPFYIGSTYEDNIKLNGYVGSVSSKKWKTIFKREFKSNRHLFSTRILSYFLTDKEARAEELRLQKMHLVVKNGKYFNESYAIVNGMFGRDVSAKLNPMFGKRHRQSTKDIISEVNKDMVSVYNKLLDINEKVSKEEFRENRDKYMCVSDRCERTPEYNKKYSKPGELNPMFGKRHSSETRLKIGEKSKGRCSRHYIVYDNKDNIVIESKEDFAKLCSKMNYPYKTFADSYRNNNKIYSNITSGSSLGRLKSSGNIQYKNWYVREIK